MGVFVQGNNDGTVLPFHSGISEEEKIKKYLYFVLIIYLHLFMLHTDGACLFVLRQI